MYGSKTMELLSLSKAAAIQLFQMWTGPADSAASKRIISRLSYHALADYQAGVFISTEFGIHIGQCLGITI